MINLQSREEKEHTFVVFNLNYTINTIVQCTQKSVSVLNHSTVDLRDFSKRAPDS